MEEQTKFKPSLTNSSAENNSYKTVSSKEVSEDDVEIINLNSKQTAPAVSGTKSFASKDIAPPEVNVAPPTNLPVGDANSLVMSTARTARPSFPQPSIAQEQAMKGIPVRQSSSQAPLRPNPSSTPRPIVTQSPSSSPRPATPGLMPPRPSSAPANPVARPVSTPPPVSPPRPAVSVNPNPSRPAIPQPKPATAQRPAATRFTPPSTPPPVSPPATPPSNLPPSLPPTPPIDGFKSIPPAGPQGGGHLPNQGPLQRIIIIAASTFLVLAIGAGLFYYFTLRDKNTETSTEQTNSEQTPSTESPAPATREGKYQPRLTLRSKELELIELRDLPARVKELASTDKDLASSAHQVIIKHNGEEINFADFRGNFGIQVPENIAQLSTDEKFAFFVFVQNNIPTVGLTMKVTGSPESTKDQMTDWEKTMVGDLRPLLLSETTNDPGSDFRFKNSSKNPNGRFITLSESKGLSIDYVVLSDRIVLATNFETANQTMDIINSWEEN